MSIGANLRRLRTDRGMSQAELAVAVSVTQSMIAQVERGTKALTLELGREISDTLGVSLNELLEEPARHGAWAADACRSGKEVR